MSIASNAFKICGIWPYNQNFFSDSDLLAASTSDVTLTKDEPETTFDVQQPFPSVNEQKYFWCAPMSSLHQKTSVGASAWTNLDND